jgi:hypothetical protein
MYFVENIDFSGANLMLQKYVFENKAVMFAGIVIYMFAFIALGMQAVFSFHAWSSKGMLSAEKTAIPVGENNASSMEDKESLTILQENERAAMQRARWAAEHREKHLIAMGGTPMEKEIIGVLWDASIRNMRQTLLTRDVVYENLPNKDSYSRRKVYATLASMARRNKIGSCLNEQNLSDRKILWCV